MDISINTIGDNKGAKRLWLQGKKLERAGFFPRTPYRVEETNGCLVVTKKGIALRAVSSRKRDDIEIPIIDINNNQSLSIFDGMDQVRVIFDTDEIRIEPIASIARAKERIERVRTRLQDGVPLKFGSLAHGGGVMDDALQQGFSDTGVKTELHFANEIREDLTDHAMSLARTWKKKTIALIGKMQEFAFDRNILDLIGDCDVLSAGLPCSGASVSGRVKRRLAIPEDHPEVGHLVVAFLAIIARVNPVAIIFENVVPYASSASMSIMRSQLEDMQYVLHEIEDDGREWGAFENRKRMVMIAVTKGMEFSFADLIKPTVPVRRLSDVWEDVPLDDPRWSKMEGLKAKEVRDAAADKSFKMQIFDKDSTKICTLTKGLAKVRSTDAKVRHPTNPDLLRIPTPFEHCDWKQIPRAMIQRLSPTIAHEMLGQSVIYEQFVNYGGHLAKSIVKLLQLQTNSIFGRQEPEPFELAFS